MRPSAACAPQAGGTIHALKGRTELCGVGPLSRSGARDPKAIAALFVKNTVPVLVLRRVDPDLSGLVAVNRDG